MLVVTPAPYSQESLFGYLVRLSESNGYHSPTVVTSYAGYSRGGSIGLRTDLQGISDVTGVELNKLQSIGYVTETDGPRAYSLLGIQISHGLANQYLWPRQRTICPECIHDSKYIEAFWDLKFAVACPKHGIEALHQCQTCGDELSWLRPGLLTCHCGATLTSNNCKKIDNSTRHLLTLIHKHLHGQKVQGLNEEYFSKHVKRLNLLELLHLVRTLGKYGVLSERQDQGKQTTIQRQVKVAAEALADWPHGLHRYFERLGKYFQHENESHIGLRAQFSPIYNALFKHKRFVKKFEFIRTEFVRFGAESWGSAVIDKKLYRDASYSEIDRFISVAVAARRLQVSPRTLRDWCAAGHVPCKSARMKKGKRYVIDSHYIAKFERHPGETMDARKAAASLGIPVSVLKLLKSSAFYSSDHLPKIMRGYHQNDLVAFKEKLAKASSSAILKTPQSESQSTLDSVLKSSKWWATDAKVNLLCAFIDGRVKPIGKVTMEPLSVYFDDGLILEFMGAANSSEFSDALTHGQAAKIISCSHLCITEMMKQEIITASHGTGCRIVCSDSLDRFDKRYLALNSIANSQSTSVPRLQRLAHQLQLNVLEIKIPKGFTTPFIERSSLEMLLAAFKQQCEERLEKKRLESADDRDVRAVKQYLHNLTQSQQPLPTRGNKLNKMAIAKAIGLRRNSIIYNTEIQKLLEDHSKQDVKQHDVKIGSQLDILEEFLRRVTDSAYPSPLIRNGKPNKKRIAREAGISREVFYKNKDDANKILERYLSA